MAAAEERATAGFILPRDLVFVDLETTGGNAAFHRITEVGIVRMQDDRVVEEWSSLVNPECRIPAYIEAFTGITNDYQPPTECELRIDTSTRSVADATDEIERMLAETGILFNELVDLAANI